MIEGENMAVKTRKPPIEEEEEEEEPVKRPVAKKPVERDSERAMREAKSSPATKAKAAVAATPQSARWYVTQVLLAGAPREEVKKRAMALAKKDGAVVSFKTFDVAYFIKYLEGKNYRVREANGTIKVMAPKG
jgi:hypothetical protein